MKRMAKTIGLWTVTNLLAGVALGAPLDWDPTGGGTTFGGDGTWSTAGDWWNGSTNVNWTAGSDAVFGGTAGTVNLGTSQTAGDVNFATSGYTIEFNAGGNNRSLTLTSLSGQVAGTTFTGRAGGTGNVTLVLNGDISFNGTIAMGGGVTGMDKSGPGKLTLTSGLTYTADRGLTISGGRVRLDISDSILPSIGISTVAGQQDAILELAYGGLNRPLGAMTSGIMLGRNFGAELPVGFAAIGGDRTINLSNTGAINWNNYNSGGFTLNELKVYELVLNATGATGKVTLESTSGGFIRLNNVASTTEIRRIRVDDGTAAVDAEIKLALAQGTGATGGLDKLGDGVLLLSADNTYTGGTTVTAGTLLINNTSGSGTGSGDVTVADGATLGGTGSIALASGKSVTVNAGGTLTGTLTVTGGGTVIAGTHSPGNSPGVSNHTALTYNTGANVEWELIANDIGTRGTHFDGINVSGDLTFSGATALDLVFDLAESSVAWGEAFWNASHLGTGGWLIYDVAGTTTGFDNLSLNVIDWLDGNDAALSSLQPKGEFSLYLDGNDIYLNYALIPEPASFVLLALAGLALLRRRR